MGRLGDLDSPGTKGTLALLGGGEFTFGETEERDEAWLERTPSGAIGFLPAASGSIDYARHFATYMVERFGREVEVIPIYRERDARRGRNAERIRDCAAVYLSGGVTDHLIEALADTPALEALRTKLDEGGVVVAMAAAAQACGVEARSVFGGTNLAGFGFVPDTIIETNFDPAHDRRLRKLLEAVPGRNALALPAESALFLDRAGVFEAIGTVFRLAGADAELVPLMEEEARGNF